MKNRTCAEVSVYACILLPVLSSLQSVCFCAVSVHILYMCICIHVPVLAPDLLHMHTVLCASSNAFVWVCL